MLDILRGLIAGFIATLAILLLLILKDMVGLSYNLNTMPLLRSLSQQPNPLLISPAIGWIIHFLIFSLLWSFVFTLITAKGLRHPVRIYAMGFCLFAWLFMMLLTMPLAGNGYFALQKDLWAPLLSLLLHLVWGWILAIVYEWLPSTSS